MSYSAWAYFRSLILPHSWTWFKMGCQLDHMLSSANRKLFALRWLKEFGVWDQESVIIYTGYVRPVLEYAVPVWHSSSTTDQIKRLERVQKRVCKIILGQRYQGYSNALSLLGLCTLAERRVQLCLDFARKLYKSSQVYTSLETGYHHSGSRWLDARWETTANRKIQDITYSLYVETFKQLRILNERIDVFSLFFLFYFMWSKLVLTFYCNSKIIQCPLMTNVFEYL